MKRKLFAITLACLAIGLLGSCQKDNGDDTLQQNDFLVGALSGKFSVSATRQVCFSQGNLYYDGGEFNFEANQYDSQKTWSESHVSLFYWSKDASVACAKSYFDFGASADDVFFTNATTETAKADFTVNGIIGKYRTLSKEEWQYLFGTSTERKGKYKCEVTVCEKENCLVLAPDDFAGSIADSYDAAAWADAEAAGLVCLPATGQRLGSMGVVGFGSSGLYLSSSADGISKAYRALFTPPGNTVTPDYSDFRDWGCSVRLVTDVN